YDLGTNEVTWDSRCKALFGLPESQVNTTYQGFLSHLHPEDRKLTEDLITHLLEEEGDYDVIHRVIWPDESVHWLRCKGRLRKGPHTQLIGAAVDVGWLKFSQEEYRQLADQLRKANCG